MSRDVDNVNNVIPISYAHVLREALSKDEVVDAYAGYVREFSLLLGQPLRKLLNSRNVDAQSTQRIVNSLSAVYASLMMKRHLRRVK